MTHHVLEFAARHEPAHVLVEHCEKHLSIFCRTLRETCVDLLSYTTRHIRWSVIEHYGKHVSIFYRTQIEKFVTLLSEHCEKRWSIFCRANRSVRTLCLILRSTKFSHFHHFYALKTTFYRTLEIKKIFKTICDQVYFFPNHKL